MIAFRLGQRLMTNPVLAPIASAISSRIDTGRGNRQQLAEVWSPTYERHEEREEDISHINIINKFKGGNTIVPKTISYLNDRYKSK